MQKNINKQFYKYTIKKGILLSVKLEQKNCLFAVIFYVKRKMGVQVAQNILLGT